MMKPDQINQQTNDGLTALMFAAVGTLPNHPAIVNLLVEAEQKQGSDQGIDLTDSFGRTALHHTAYGYQEVSDEVKARKKTIFDSLVQAGADPLKEDKAGNTPAQLMQSGPK